MSVSLFSSPGNLMQNSESFTPILLIEDNPLFRQSFRKILANRFPAVDILEAGSGREAFEIMGTLHPGLVFIDINLPDLNGFEISKQIRSTQSGCVIFILTSYDFPEYRQAAFKHGADFFFSKDCKPEEIMAAVESLMGNQAAPADGKP